ncbi:hypothetical protein AA101099_0328 [Neoasaia chiangmaiensis NBRC 101099]|uniref:Uncharacterized protein n=1 Tax=Neoasaia chiangmaiensis TaxID=320497 RepID=A0A1U9KRP6_9PROT|nr:DUF1501 domain-containing protein [Neoasaia chiangmaiensis]AQS88544.1 hypothetical protein A0U93_12025 [Neoasaia chiangmaiensis]GBR36342.1 hypothetical protein AA101099_0328 [Neoasaia chiangmaiensis NBRC 101099]GEN15378.1 hypothetical protein NCH01_18090 [Neoasaia chiangmaiensis]
MMLRRRSALLGLTASWMLGRSSLAMGAVAAGPDDPRFVVIILRGALDGMAAVTPYGDPNLIAWRRDLLLPEPGREGGLLDLGGFHGLHPALSGMHDLYGAGQLLPVHAVAGHYRSRSHFEAQDYLESGADERLTSGWLNRVVGALPRHSSQPDGSGLAMGLSVPLLLRGPARIGNFAPAGGQRPDADLYAQIAALNATDPTTGPAFRNGLKARGFSEDALRGDVPATGDDHHKPSAFVTLADAAGHMLADSNGPRIAALEAGGWDTHAAQKGRLTGPLKQLDAGLTALRTAMGPAWSRAAVLVMTEFGRTVRMNGTGGTDHGTGTVAFLAGGAVAGGRIGGTWPGLRQDQLFEDRDLAPTTDLRAVASGVLRDHLGLKRAELARVFPGSDATPLGGLIRAA